MGHGDRLEYSGTRAPIDLAEENPGACGLLGMTYEAWAPGMKDSAAGGGLGMEGWAQPVVRGLGSHSYTWPWEWVVRLGPRRRPVSCVASGDDLEQAGCSG